MIRRLILLKDSDQVRLNNLNISTVLFVDIDPSVNFICLVNHLFNCHVYPFFISHVYRIVIHKSRINLTATQPMVPPEGGLRQLVALTQDVVRGTRSVAQDIVCPRRGLRRYVTLTQDIDPPKGVRHIVTY
jgi:hypothetical protein